jgi:hypothetical protein
MQFVVAIWFKMGSRNATQVWLTDEEASCRARIPLHDIPGAQFELARTRLLKLFPGDGQTRYTFVDDPDNLTSSTATDRVEQN